MKTNFFTAGWSALGCGLKALNGVVREKSCCFFPFKFFSELKKFPLTLLKEFSDPTLLSVWSLFAGLRETLDLFGLRSSLFSDGTAGTFQGSAES
jgi:hypothetical protein